MFKLDGISAFISIIDAGSVSAGATRLGVAKSVASDRLAELERILGTKLIQRTTRKLSLTEDGLTFIPRARRILREAEEATAELAARSGTLAGPLRISAPVSFGVLHLGPAIFEFLRQHPDINLSLELDDRFVDAAAEGFDAVIRHGAIRDSRLVARRIATSRRHLVASPDYLERHGTPKIIDDLSCHRAILYSNRPSDWRFEAERGGVVVRPLVALRVNNGILMREAAVAGLGLTLLPGFFIHSELSSGKLVKVDLGAEAEQAALFITYARDHGSSNKIRALADQLKKSIGNAEFWD